jgi:chromosome segregation ATPase
MGKLQERYDDLIDEFRESLELLQDYDDNVNETKSALVNILRDIESVVESEDFGYAESYFQDLESELREVRDACDDFNKETNAAHQLRKDLEKLEKRLKLSPKKRQVSRILKSFPDFAV